MRIIIVGGGTAGWSCAAALSKNKNLDITIIDAKDSSSIGVGESTLPLIHQFHNKFRLFEDDSWIKRVNGTLKFTLEFEGFMKNSRSKWVHPLSTNKDYEQFMSLRNTQLDNLTLSDKFFYSQNLRNSSYNDIDKSSARIGAFHLDALLYSKELKKVALKRGVKFLEKSVKEIIKEGEITKYIVLDDKERLEAELFIDSTGFKNLFFENVPFESFSNRLFCDKAVAIKLPYKDLKKQKINATLAKALKNGWVWHVPLENNIGVGYVYSSRHINDDEAKKELCLYLKNNYGYELENDKFLSLSYRVGVHKNSWIGNNVAIGLSSFFIEPIESTGIALFQIQIMELADILESNPRFYKNFIPKYNKRIYDYVCSVKDFIEMHYILSNRDDSRFWIDSSNIEINKLQNKIINFYEKQNYSELLNFSLSGIFGNLSWFHLLLGMDSNKDNNIDKC